MRDIRIGVGICAHNDEEYIAYALRAIYDSAHVIAVNVDVGQSWGGVEETPDRTMEIVRGFPDPEGKLRIAVGEWPSEIDQRNASLDVVRGEANYYMVLDPDEIYSFEDLARLKRFIAWRPHIGQFRIRLNTYWKTNPFCVIDPPEPLRAYVISRIRPSTRFVGLRNTNERWRSTVPRKVAVMRHFSYARSSESVLRKLRNFSHRDQIVPNWFENVWLRWNSDHTIENLHPTNPPEYKRAIPVKMDDLPEVMREHPFAKAD